MKKKCNYCEIEFEPKNPKGKYCSDKCRVYASRKEKTTIRNLNEQTAGTMQDLTKSPTSTNYTINTIPKTLDELKALCPKELEGFDRSQWISQERLKYGI